MAAHSPTYSLAVLAKQIGAHVIGEETALVSGIASLDKAGSQDLSFVVSGKYKVALIETQAGAVIMQAGMSEYFAGNKLIVDDPYLAYAKLSALFDYRPNTAAGIHPTAVIADTAVIAKTASIGPHVVIGDHVHVGEHTMIAAGCVIEDNVKLGEHCRLYANVCIYHSVIIDQHVTIHANTVIGSDGFGYAPSNGAWHKIHQLGRVKIGKHVEIGASCTIDRGALDDTIIEEGVIIDNQVHIAHNVHVGAGSALAGCVGVAGSTRIGAGCTFGGQTGVAGHLNIHPGSHFNGGSVVLRDTNGPGIRASAIPAMDVKAWRRNVAHFAQLDALVKRVKQLEKQQEERDS